MGYRSDTGLVITKEALTQVAKNKEALEWLKEAISYANENEYLFVWENIKWYDEGDNLESELDKLENSEDFLLIRIGESVNDMEISGGMWNNSFNFTYVRKLDFEDNEKNEIYDLSGIEIVCSKPGCQKKNNVGASKCWNCGNEL